MSVSTVKVGSTMKSMKPEQKQKQSSRQEEDLCGKEKNREMNNFYFSIQLGRDKYGSDLNVGKARPKGPVAINS